jgi:hypothetical protein
LIAFQGVGHEIIRVYGILDEGGDLLYKESGFSPLLLFSIPSPLTSNSSSLHILSSIMSSYTEVIICMARNASGPSIWDMEVIRSFQSRPTTKDAVSTLFISL